MGTIISLRLNLVINELHCITTVLAHPLSVLMLTKREWHLCLVLLEEAAPEVVALEVDLVAVPPVHAHSVKIETKRSRIHSP